MHFDSPGSMARWDWEEKSQEEGPECRSCKGARILKLRENTHRYMYTYTQMNFH